MGRANTFPAFAILQLKSRTATAYRGMLTSQVSVRCAENGRPPSDEERWRSMVPVSGVRGREPPVQLPRQYQ